jgi:hypothetical protein
MTWHSILIYASLIAIGVAIGVMFSGIGNCCDLP